MTTNLDEMEAAYIKYDLLNGGYEILASLPAGVELTAGQDDLTHAVCDVSHWIQADLDEFASLDTENQVAIIENLEFQVFSNEMREIGSGYGMVFGMGGSK